VKTTAATGLLVAYGCEIWFCSLFL